MFIVNLIANAKVIVNSQIIIIAIIIINTLLSGLLLSNHLLRLQLSLLPLRSQSASKRYKRRNIR